MPVKHYYGKDGSQLYDYLEYIEEFLRLIQMHQILDQYQMPGRGYGQPLRISFHYSEKYYLQYLDDVHASTIRIIYLVSASL